MTAFSLIAPPSVEPVSLNELKAHARMDTNADDPLAGALITASRQWAENYTRRAFITQSWRLSLDAGPKDSIIELPRPPLVSVTSVTVYDDNDNGEVWDAGNYFVDTEREPGRLVLRNDQMWPVAERSGNGMVIEYVAGYGSAASSVPEPVKLAIKQLAAHWYEHRGEAVMMSSSRNDAIENRTGVNMPLVIQALLDPFMIRSVRA